MCLLLQQSQEQMALQIAQLILKDVNDATQCAEDTTHDVDDPS
jgi:hypothetical protein